MILAPLIDASKEAELYINGLITFWGLIFTLILFTAYIGPFALLFFRAQKESKEEGKFLDFKEWLSSNDFDKGKFQRIKHTLTLLAPFLVGSIQEVFINVLK